MSGAVFDEGPARLCWVASSSTRALATPESKSRGEGPLPILLERRRPAVDSLHRERGQRVAAGREDTARRTEQARACVENVCVRLRTDGDCSTQLQRVEVQHESEETWKGDRTEAKSAQERRFCGGQAPLDLRSERRPLLSPLK